jgi:hypothetical protein
VAHARASHADELCTAIRRHLASHPLAADTVEGILACWLPPAGFEDAADHIEAALAELVATRWLHRVSLPDGNVLYAANEERCSTSPLTSSRAS